MLPPDDDWSCLMRAALAGDAAAYGRFLREVTPVLRGVIGARGRGLPRDRQEDIVQEVLLAIHAKRHTWAPDLPIRPWLYAIVRHKVIDAFRAGGRAVHVQIEDVEEVLAADMVSDPLAARDLAILIGQLDGRSAEIVRAVGIADETTEAVGARLGMTEGAVRVALHCAIKRMARFAKGARP